MDTGKRRVNRERVLRLALAVAVCQVRKGAEEEAPDKGPEGGEGHGEAKSEGVSVTKYTTMYYSTSGYVGIRVKGGRQVCQIGKRGVGGDTLEKAAKELIVMLEKGNTTEQVKDHWSQRMMPNL